MALSVYGSANVRRGTGFSRECGISNDPFLVTVTASSRLKPVPRLRTLLQQLHPAKRAPLLYA
jgi:hypothetical protein